MTEIEHRMIGTNGIRMHLAEQGTGPLVQSAVWVSYVRL